MGDDTNLITDDITLSLDNFDDGIFVNDTGSEYTFNTFVETEFVHKLPSVQKINNMCKHYPALAKAYENFKTIYNMVEQDYIGNHEESDNEIAF